jgi:hypothetical protein
MLEPDGTISFTTLFAKELQLDTWLLCVEIEPSLPLDELRTAEYLPPTASREPEIAISSTIPLNLGFQFAALTAPDPVAGKEPAKNLS